MSIEHLPANKTIRASGPSPRNHWLRLATAMECLADGRANEAWRILQALRHTELPAREVIDPAKRLTSLALLHGSGLRLDLPSDYLRTAPAKRFQPRLRRFLRPATAPFNFPADMSLPPPTGNANDFSFITDAARQHCFSGPLPDLRLRLVLVLRDARDCDLLAAGLSRLMSEGLLPRGTTLRLSGPASLHGLSLPLPARWSEALPWQLEPGWQTRWLGEGTDVILFMPVAAIEDRLFLQRTLRYFALSENLCLVLTSIADCEATVAKDQRPTLLADWLVQVSWQNDPYAFRSIDNLAFAIAADRFCRLDGFETRFVTEQFACRELALRLFLSGCYFLPLPVRADLPSAPRGLPHEGDKALFAELNPDHTDRAATEHHERPKVSVCIPAQRAEHFLAATIESILAQDFHDLEICVADDGSPDATVKVLESFANEPRLRWVSGPSGGVGHACNRALGLARGLYLGQLDAEIRLIPGAIGRLVEHLDENPTVGCVYASGVSGDSPDYRSESTAAIAPFSRERAMLGPVGGHFPMFRHQVWKRIEGLSGTIDTAIFNDLILKMSEVTQVDHIATVLHQRRRTWVRAVNAQRQADAEETVTIQREALERLGLDGYWSVGASGPENPGISRYSRKGEGNRVFFWPDYTPANPYQRMLYARVAERAEVMAGDINVALGVVRKWDHRDGGKVIFHLHWLNMITETARTAGEAALAAGDFLEKLKEFRSCGGRLVWTIHNAVSHDLPFAQVETELAQAIAGMADGVHVHSLASLPEIEACFAVPRNKLHIARHGNYRQAYPNFVGREQARAELQIDHDDEVVLFLGHFRPYKGVEDLLRAFRAILPSRPRARLVLAGNGPLEGMLKNADLTTPVRSRITVINRFVDDMEMQLFFNAADFAVYPYRRILTSGSLMLALSYGVPALVPACGMTREVLGKGKAGILYDADGLGAALETALREMFQLIDQGDYPGMVAAARQIADGAEWEDIGPLLFGSSG